MTGTNDALAAHAGQLLRQGRAADACSLLETAVANGAGDPALIRLLVQSLAQAGDLYAALDRQATLLPQDIARADAQGREDTLAAAQLAQVAGDHSHAAALARALAERDPGDAQAAQLLSTLVLWSDGPEAARAVLGGVAAADAPPHMVAQMLAFDDDPDAPLAARAAALARDDSVAPQERADLLLALAQHHDRAGRFDDAWDAATRGNALASPRSSQDWRAVLAAHLRIARETEPAPAAGGPRHLYLIGTPRSGQSLLQSIFAAAPGVASLGERGALLQHLLFRTGEVSRMAPAARAALFAQLAEADRRGIARLARDAHVVVDKSPLHLAIAGSIARVHPEAAFAAVVRDPADAAMSIWLRSFPPVYDYATDMSAIVDQLDFALDALAAWRGAGLRVDLVDHAQLVASPGSVGRTLFEAMGLDWDDRYLAPENRTQPVATFSAAQVRRPIASASSRSAQAYAERLSPWAERLDEIRRKTSRLLAQGSRQG
jgi:hypothetical protein